MNKATLTLFNAIQVDTKKKAKDLLLTETVKHGFILTPEAASAVDAADIAIIADIIGISGEKANAAFHKSWKIVAESSMEDLVEQQIIHYITTYGFEAMGIYREDAVYIPAEQLDIPKIKDSIRLVVIKGLTKEEILTKIIELGSGIALKTETLALMMEIIEKNKYDESLVKKVSNRELKTKLYDYFEIVPSDPLEFLRYIINKLTDESLLIKNGKLIAKIKESKTPLHVKTLDRQLEQAPKNLAEIFFRYKPLFLAMKSVSKNKTFFNQLRKKAEKMHKPMEESFLNTVTDKLKNNRKIPTKTLNDELAEVNIFRKIRLAYALKFRTGDNDAIVYRIRNGKGFASEFEFKNKTGAEDALETVLAAIAKDLKHVKGKTIYIPDSINYALPATEKMFTGNFPTGTYVAVPESMIVGVHWFDTNGRVDMDLSTVSAEGKIGWDANYRTSSGDVLFSGDVTAAPKPRGASELFYIKKGTDGDKIMYVNYFNFQEGNTVDLKILVAAGNPKNFGNNYMVDISDIIASATIPITKQSNILGLITKVGKENRFYFANTSIGNNITSGYDDHSALARQYFAGSMIDSLDFREILESAGAKIVDEKPKKGEFVDLSPEALDKTTIINLITKKA